MPDNPKPTNSYIKYTAVAFQMLATIGIFAFIGYKIDERRNTGQFLFAALLGLAGVAISLYQVVKSLNRGK